MEAVNWLSYLIALIILVLLDLRLMNHHQADAPVKLLTAWPKHVVSAAAVFAGLTLVSVIQGRPLDEDLLTLSALLGLGLVALAITISLGTGFIRSRLQALPRAAVAAVVILLAAAIYGAVSYYPTWQVTQTATSYYIALQQGDEEKAAAQLVLKPAPSGPATAQTFAAAVEQARQRGYRVQSVESVNVVQHEPQVRAQAVLNVSLGEEVHRYQEELRFGPDGRIVDIQGQDPYLAYRDPDLSTP